MKLQALHPITIVILLPLAIVPHIIANLDIEKQALLDFASSFPHVRKLNWNFSLAICKSWTGITCNKDETRVVAIHLPGFGLFGHIPANTIGKLDALKVLSLRANHLNGSLPSDILSIPSLKSLYLQHNNFSGDIPISFSPKLGVLDLSFNSFTGEIPPTIMTLTRLSVLNLQFNSLSGTVPIFDASRLSLLNVSYNMLSGSIPHSLKKFPPSSFVGNSNLCGTPLGSCSSSARSPIPGAEMLLSSPAIPEKHQGPNFKKLSKRTIIAIAIGASLLMVLLVTAIFICCLNKNVSNSTSMDNKENVANEGGNEKSEDFESGMQDAEKNKLMFFEGCSHNYFDLEDLLRASSDFLGKGSYGTAYKVALDEVTTVVVKRLREVGVGKKEFGHHMEIVGRVRQHPNVVPLYACYYSKDEKLLVCEYMPAGNLSSALHGNRGSRRSSLDWDTRLKISLGAAKGIAHIHCEGGGQFIHGNIKSSNVLLTKDLDGCISDYGLSPLMNSISIKYKGAGYLAPEVIATRKGTQKSDVYSFGVLLLELLTGKSPLPLSSGHDDHIFDLPRWVRYVVKEEWTAEVFDVELMKYQDIEEEMVQMLQIALQCVTKVPDMRPTMSQVTKMIEELSNHKN